MDWAGDISRLPLTYVDFPEHLQITNWGASWVMARRWSASKVLLALSCGIGLALPAFASETITFTYDELGRLVAATSSGTINNGQSVTAGYDPAGNRTAYTINGAPGSPPANPAPSFSIGDASGTEGATLSFAVTKTGSTASTYTVNYATATGTASSSDFTAASGTLAFAPSDTIKYVTVQTLTDSLTEAAETFTINLSSPSGGATITDSQGVGTIQDGTPSGGGGGGMCGNYFC